jgi:hypothetical protein
MNRLQAAAATWHDALFGPMATMPGEKRPHGSWRQYQTRPAPLEHVTALLNGDGQSNLGVVLLPGQEALDVEGRAVADGTWQKVIDAAAQTGVDQLLSRVMAGYHETTPSGGIHLLWWCNTASGNQKLASRPRPDGGEDTLIETRGPGGFLVVAPSTGWDWQAGSPSAVAEISDDERDDLLALFRAFDERANTPTSPPANITPGQRPGDDYNQQATWDEVLNPHGWTKVRTGTRGETWWRRPGKDRGWSATTGATANDTLHVHSTSTPFTPSPTSYNKFSAYTLLNHNGDHASAAAQLAREGYGDPPATSTATTIDVDDPSGYGDALTRELARQRLQRDARRVLEAEDRPPARPPEILTLRQRMARPHPPITYRIDGWQPSGSRIMLAAQFKAGKTTLVGNIARCLLDGDLWLGQYSVQPLTGTLVILDLEMSAHQLDGWLADQRIVNDDRIVPIPLRGNAGCLDIIDPKIRTQWADRLRKLGCEYLVLDCLRPIMDALGLDEHRDAGRFLVALDALLAEAGISDALIVHHMGHTAERSRGDSRIRDWPDVEWRLVREDPDDPGSARYVSAYGRDVDIPESQLEHDPTTRHLIVLGGSRKESHGRGALTDVEAVIGAQEMSGNEIEKALKDSEHSREAVRMALKIGVRDSRLAARSGPRNAKLYRQLASSRPVRGSSPGEVSESTSHLAAALIERRGGEVPRTHPARSPTSSPDGELICTICQQPLDPTATADGHTTHPLCQHTS